MTDAELGTLTRDWPNEAKPVTRKNAEDELQLWFFRDAYGLEGFSWCTPDGKSVTGVKIPTEEAAMFHTASGMLYLIGEGYHEWKWNDDERDGEDVPVRLDLYHHHFEGQSILHAISAAIRAVTARTTEPAA